MPNLDLKNGIYVNMTTLSVTLSLRIKVQNRDGVDWYSIDQSQDLAQFIVDEGMANIRPVSAPMPDRKELLSNPNEVSLTEHKWIRSTVGSLSYFALPYKLPILEN